MNQIGHAALRKNFGIMWAGISKVRESVRCWWEGLWWLSTPKGFTDQEIWTWFPIILTEAN